MTSSQPFVTQTIQRRTEFFDNLIAEYDSKNPLGNKKLSVQVTKEWVGILLPLLNEYLIVSKDYARDSTPRGKVIFIRSIEIANKLICILNQAVLKKEPIIIRINYDELEIILDTVELKLQLLRYDNETVEPILEDIHGEFHRMYWGSVRKSK